MQVTFETDFFKPESREDEETSPGRYGRSLAHWLKDQLVGRGVSVVGIVPEDFGWVVMVSRKPFLLWLGCGNTEGSTTEWSIFPKAELSLTQRLFSRPDTSAAVRELWAHVQLLVPAIPGLRSVTWE
ncbi:MAG TPA: hypothetical protein PK668_25490 [Myxococcota bacterium]|nr:hypothetical protein [Myxococcota bacterium]HRY95223.1 hypothetical protein [Myxococcota bacterium]